jgi:hypothetical protein
VEFNERKYHVIFRIEKGRYRIVETTWWVCVYRFYVVYFYHNAIEWDITAFSYNIKWKYHSWTR